MINPTVSRYLKIILILVITFILQTTLLGFISIQGVTPNLLLVFAICFASINANITICAVMGGVCGFLLDISGGRVFGVNMLLCIYFCIGCAFLAKKYFRAKLKVTFVFTFMVSALYQMLYYLLYIGIWGNGNFINTFITIILPSLLYDSAVCIIMYFILKKLLPKPVSN